jgi:hypothetical protein
MNANVYRQQTFRMRGNIIENIVIVLVILITVRMLQSKGGILWFDNAQCGTIPLNASCTLLLICLVLTLDMEREKIFVLSCLLSRAVFLKIFFLDFLNSLTHDLSFLYRRPNTRGRQ